MKKLTCLTFMILATCFANAQNKNFIDQPYVEVSGNADTLVTPDEIYIRIVLSEKDTKDKVSLEELEQTMVSALKSIGIDVEKQLTTSDMISSFKHYIFKSKDVIKSKVYTLKLGDAVTASQVFMKLEDVNISNTSIEKTDLSNLKQLQDQMRSKAIINAKQRAVALTKPLNQEIGPAIHIVEAREISHFLQGKVAGIQIRGISSLQESTMQLPKIEFEKIKVTADVTATFVLK